MCARSTGRGLFPDAVVRILNENLLMGTKVKLTCQIIHIFFLQSLILSIHTRILIYHVDYAFKASKLLLSP